MKEIQNEVKNTAGREDMNDARGAKLLSGMDPDDAAAIVRDLPYEKAERLLQLMGVEDAEDIRTLLGYRDETAGGMMTTQYIAMRESDTVEDAVHALRELPEDHPTVHYVYVLDDYGKLTGVLSLRTLVLAAPETPLADIMFTEVISVLPDESEEDVADDIAKYNLLAMPVVDEHGKMLGIVTFDDALDVIEEDVEETKSTQTAKLTAGVIGGLVALAIYTFIVLQIAGYLS